MARDQARRHRCTMKRVEIETEFRDGLASFSPDLILSDFSLPKFDGLSALGIARTEKPDTPFIFVSGTMAKSWPSPPQRGRPTTPEIQSGTASAGGPARDARRGRPQAAPQAGGKNRRLSRIHAVWSASAPRSWHPQRQELFQEACAIAVEHGSSGWPGSARPRRMRRGSRDAWHGSDDGYLDEVESSSSAGGRQGHRRASWGRLRTSA